MTGVLQATEDHEWHRVTPRIAPIDRAGALSEATRSVQPVRPGTGGRASQPGAAFTAAISLSNAKVEHPPDVVGKRGQAELSPNLLETPHQEGALINPLLTLVANSPVR